MAQPKSLVTNVRSPFDSTCDQVSGQVSSTKSLSTLVPQFPNFKEIVFPSNVSEEKIKSFVVMYHTHCQRVFDTIIRGSLNEAYQFIEHFWQGMPSHLLGLLESNSVVNMVGVCDSILYRTISAFLMPHGNTKCSENFIQTIRDFSDKLEVWLQSAMIDVPSNLKNIKLKLGKSFCVTLKRQSALHQLTHAAKIVFSDNETMGHICKDWQRINLEPISKQAFFFSQNTKEYLETMIYIREYWKKFQKLIEKQANLEDFTDWVRSAVHCCLRDVSERLSVPVLRIGKVFILLWHAIGSRISRDMTIHSAVSFGSFHLIQTMFDEYMQYLVEMLHSEDVTKYLMKNVSLDILPNLDDHYKINTEYEETISDVFHIDDLNDLSGETLDFSYEDESAATPVDSCSDFPFPSNGTKLWPRNESVEPSDLGFCCREFPSDIKLTNSSGYEDDSIAEDVSGCDNDNVELTTGLFFQEQSIYLSNNFLQQDFTFDDQSSFSRID